MKRVSQIFFLCLILPLSVYAQTVRVLNLKDGLSNNYAQCILQDKQGYIWIGTHDGLNRYNGHDLKVYKNELGSSFIYSLMQDSKGRIWVGTSRGGINLYYPEEERFERLKIKGKVYDYLDGKDVYSLYEDNFHNIWVGTLQGLARIPPSMDTITWYENHMQDFSQTFTSVTTTQPQQLLFGSNQGLFTIDPRKETLVPLPLDAIPELKGVFVHDIKQDSNGALWIATDSKGIFKLDPDKKTLHNFSTAPPARLKSNQAWKLFIDNKADVWATFINGGIYRYDKASENFISYQERISTEFNSESITGILEDFNGNIWITSHGDGACYFNPRKYVFEKYLSGQGEHDGGQTSIVSAFFEDKSGSIWVGTDGQGLKKISSGNKITNEFSLSNGLSSNVVLDIIEDEKKNTWLATWQGGVNVIDKIRNVAIFNEKDAAPFGLKVPDVKALLKDSNGNIWMVSHGGGIVIYDTRNKKFIDPHTVTAAFRADAGRWGSDILEAKNGDIWIASHAGLFRYSSKTLDQYFPGGHENALSSSLVYCVFEDSNGNIWAGTNTSLEKYLPEKNGFENYSRNYTVPGNIKCILEDDKGKLWLSTVNEIVEFDPETKKVRHFNQSYNIQQGQFYECACLRTKAGKFYFGGTEGFNAFWPDSVKDDQTFSRVFINDLYLFNKRQTPNDQDGVLTKAMPFTSELVLSHAQNVMSFEFLALNYSAFAKNLYSYKMTGFDKEWSPPSEARMATYTNLDPGEYTFQVRAVSLDQIVLSETALKLKVVPPFWQTMWFKTLAIFVLGGLIIGFFLLRLQASRTKRLILQQLVAERTKEVSDKNLLLETQTQDLQKKNEALITQETKIREQANVLAQQKDLLQQNNLTLAELNTTKDRLFSIIAHDLRNPFTSLLGYTQLLNSEFNRYNDEEKQKLIRSLYHSSSSIYSLLENLLVWSKSQQNVLVFSPEKIFLKAIVEEHFDLMKDEAEKKDVTLQLAAEKEIVFFADRNMFSIILRNLLFNALKYSPVHGSIEVCAAIEGTGLQLSIKDEGSGIDDGMELFEVSAVASKHRDHNHGLGLILCKEFVEKHGGKIKAVNNPDRGACFSFTLPSANAVTLETNEAFHLNHTAVTHEQATDEDITSLPTVLVAEDDDEIRWYIKQILFPEFQVLESVNGADGDLLAQEKIPDVIISDLAMPKMDGLEFCRKIKSREQTSHIPFIMLTAERSNDKKVSGYGLGADDFITKPIQPNVLRARLHNIIDNRKRLKAIYQRDITSLPETFTTNTVDQSFLERLNAIIENQIANPELNPDSLAREVSMSRTGLYMKVKALTGESVGIYIRNVRLKESKKLLKTRKYNISEVAYAVGFNQLPYFTTCFKEAFGITPTEFISKNGA